jgi:hypothetical protein
MGVHSAGARARYRVDVATRQVVPLAGWISLQTGASGASSCCAARARTDGPSG